LVVSQPDSSASGVFREIAEDILRRVAEKTSQQPPAAN
jgi:hypothetical protein